MAKRASQGPLADRMRPRTLDEVVGQEHLTAPGAPLRRAIEASSPFSLILWGPPGTGKTTIAFLFAQETGCRLVAFSAVLSGMKEVRQVLEEARRIRSLQGKPTALFVDELHRFNKAQQDAFLPHVEKGDIIFLGATTENPSFEVNAALLSRCQVFVLHSLTPEHILTLMLRSLKDPQRGLASLKPSLEQGVLESIAEAAGGDARVALNILESMVLGTRPDSTGTRHISLEEAKRLLQQHPLLYDKAGEEHFNLISALHKSLRGGDPDASLYWLARMLEAGEDPLYVARRMVRFASEDVGLADPMALQVALAAKEAFHFLGPPEGFLALAEAAVYLAMAPKSNSLYLAYGKLKEVIKRTGPLQVPLALRNPVSPLMAQMGYGKDYRYPHDDPDKVVDQQYLPQELSSEVFWEPGEQGLERELALRLRNWKDLRRKKKQEHSAK
ncbi:MAG: replication-associated recombination protein A [bacterium]